MKISVVVPAYNEAVNMPFLIEEFDKFIKKNKNYEVIVVDDGSEDGTSDILRKNKRAYLRSVRHQRNMGKTQAIMSGAKMAKGRVIVVFDADLQYDPLDIPRLVAVIESGFDIVTGWKQGDYEKKFVSNVYNFWARKLFRLEIHDMNAIKAIRKEVLNVIPMRKDWHRYVVPLAKEAGYKIAEVRVNLRPRRYGSPKYQQKSRILIGFFDLLAVKFQLSFMKKPLLYFGTVGLFSIATGVLVGVFSIVLRLFGYGFRPLLYLVILLVISGILFFSLALIGESIRAILDRLEQREV
jgi:glycosyltransferase involved in cell wall biosynthesis